MTRERLPDRRYSETFTVSCDGLNYDATVSSFRDGGLGEIFLSCHKIDSGADVSARDSAIACSLALQHGAPLDIIRKALCRDPRGLASGPLGIALDRQAAERGA